MARSMPPRCRAARVTTSSIRTPPRSRMSRMRRSSSTRPKPDAKARGRQSKIRLSFQRANTLHLGPDLRFRWTPLHCDWELPQRFITSILPRLQGDAWVNSSRATRRTSALWHGTRRATLIMAPTVPALSTASMRRARAMCFLKHRGARLHRSPSARMEPSMLLVSATRAAIHCLRCRCKGRRPLRSRWFSRSPCKRPTPARPCQRELRSSLSPRGKRTARVVVEQGFDCVCACCSAEWPARLQW